MSIVAVMHAVLLSYLCVADPAPPAEPQLKRTIVLAGVEGRIDHMACDPDSQRLFIAALGNGSLEIVDLRKGERIRSIAGLKEPQGVVFVPATGQVVVACGGDGTLRAYDAATLDAKATSDAGEDADNARLSPDGTRVLVGHGSGAIGIFDAVTLKKDADIKLPGHPESFQIEPGGSRAFANVPGGLLRGGGEVAVIDLKQRKVAAQWTLKDAGRNFPMALDAAGKRLYVGCRRPSRLLVLDTETGRTVAGLECVGDADDIFVDAESGLIYVVGGDGALDVFRTTDRESYVRSASVPTAPGARTALLVPELRSIFVAVPRRSGQEARILEFALPGPAPASPSGAEPVEKRP